jgi:polyisoprenoid-binding protein YceI
MTTRTLRHALLLGALAAAPAVARAADTYDIDPVHSFAIFRVKHLGVSFAYGRFTDVGGAVTVDPQAPEKTALAVEVRVASVTTDNAKRDEHLRGPDFFNVKEFPVASFTSASVRKTGEDAYEATGAFTLHGVTKTITVPFTYTGTGQDPMGGTRIGGEAVFTIKRSDYGVSALPGGIADEVRLVVSLEGILKK